MFYEKVYRALAEKGVRYAITGGVALVLHGVVRFTADLDLFVDLESKNLKKFIEVMKKLGFRPRVPVAMEDLLIPESRQQWYEEKNMIAFTFYNPVRPIEEIDIFVHEPIPFDEIHKEIRWMSIKDIEVPVVSIGHLKRLKALSQRHQDKADIEALDKIRQLSEDGNERS